MDLDDLDFSDWHTFDVAPALAPAVPGIYEARPAGGDVCYVGGTPKRGSLKARLRAYARGRPLTGLIGAAADRALADPAWVSAVLIDAGPLSVKELGVAALAREQVQLRWATTPDVATSARLELARRRSYLPTQLWSVH